MYHLSTFFSERSFNWDLSRQKYLGPLSYVYIIYIIYIYIYIYTCYILVIYILVSVAKNICSARWRKFRIFSTWVFRIKQHSQKDELTFIEKTIKLQKKWNWIKVKNSFVRLFDILRNFLFTTSETMRGYYL